MLEVRTYWLIFSTSFFTLRKDPRRMARCVIRLNLHLVQPGGIGRSEMYMVARRAANQRFTRGCLCVA